MPGKTKILLVENDIFQFNALKSFLVKKGFLVLQLQDEDMIGSYNEALQVIAQDIPDIAIIDIELNGNKDGIELAEYIQPLNIPIIFLTANDNQQNLERAKYLLPKGFIAKTKKPYNERNIWNALIMAMQYVRERSKLLSKGISLKVKEVNLPIFIQPKVQDIDIESQKTEILFGWDDIISFTVDKTTPKNNTLIRTTFNSKRGFLYKASLNYLETVLPIYFVRINSNIIINSYKITKHRLPNSVFIKDEVFAITDTYVSKATQRIRATLGI